MQTTFELVTLAELERLPLDTPIPLVPVETHRPSAGAETATTLRSAGSAR